MISIPSNEELSNETDPMINSSEKLNKDIESTPLLNDQLTDIANENPNECNKKIWYLFDEEIPSTNNDKEDKIKLNFSSFLGSMSDIDKIYRKDDFLKNLKWLKFFLILIDSIFRGISQVMFANNPLSGILITIGLFLGNFQLAIYALFGTTISTLTAHLLDFNYNIIRSGLYGYNGCLTGMAISFFTLDKSFEIIPFIIIMCIFSTIFNESMSKILVNHFGIPPFTFSFQISTWIIHIGTLKYQYLTINGNILKATLFTTVIDKSQQSGIPSFHYSLKESFISIFASIGQVYFIDNPYSGIIILIGIAICSRILAFFALFGAITGPLTAAYLLKISSKEILLGLWGYNTVLTCEALGGMFLVLYGYKIWLVILYGSISTIIFQATTSSYLSLYGMPALTFPFTFICWIFCLIGSTKSIIQVKLSDCNIPEDHIYRYRLSRFIKKEFKYINLLNIKSSSLNEDITNNELLEIEKELVPILMCTYAYRNELENMKILFKKVRHMNFIDENNRTPLHISASEGYLSTSKWIGKNLKTNLNSIDKYGSTPLFDGFLNGHLNIVNYLYLNGGILPSTKSKELAFYLNSLVYENNLEGVKYLIQLGFDPNQTDYDGRYSLHVAVDTNNFNMVRYLTEQTSISFHIKDRFNQTPYEYSLKLPQSDIKNYLSYKIKHTKINPNIQILIQTNSNKNLHHQYKNSSTKLEENLLPYLLSINNIDTFLIFIKENPNIKIFDLIDYDKRCLAHLSAINGQYDIIKYLYENNSQTYFQEIINQEDRWNFSPLDYAIIHKHQQIIDYIQQHLSDDIKTITVIHKNDFKTNPIISHINKWKKIYLFLTLSASGNVLRIQSLYNRQYFLKEELYADYDGRTPMHLAVANEHYNLVQFLIDHGYQGINIKDRWGYSPLDIARQMKFINIIHLLEQQL